MWWSFPKASHTVFLLTPMSLTGMLLENYTYSNSSCSPVKGRDCLICSPTTQYFSPIKSTNYELIFSNTFFQQHLSRCLFRKPQHPINPTTQNYEKYNNVIKKRYIYMFFALFKYRLLWAGFVQLHTSKAE